MLIILRVGNYSNNCSARKASLATIPKMKTKKYFRNTIHSSQHITSHNSDARRVALEHARMIEKGTKIQRRGRATSLTPTPQEDVACALRQARICPQVGYL
jgi:hypothetical protein